MTDTSFKLNERAKSGTLSLLSNRAVLFGSDLYLGVCAWRLWLTLGWNDIALRYRRSTLGPFWMTLSMAVLVVSLGIIYSQIFQTDIRTYLPYLALGFIVWGFFSSTVTESCGAFTESERIIKQIKVPFSVFVLRVVWRNFIVLMHTIILFIPIAIFFSIAPDFTMLLAIAGLAILYLNLVWLSLIIAVLSTRFRDVSQIVSSVVQIAMFATPVMWEVHNLRKTPLIADINPLYHWLQLVRGPLIGTPPSILSWVVSLGTAVLGFVLALLLLRRASRRIVYWL